MTWIAFIGLSLLALLILFVPGCLLIKLFDFSWPHGLVFGPLISSAVYAFLTIVYAAIGIRTSWYSVTLPITCIIALLLIVKGIRSRKLAGSQDADRRLSAFSFNYLLLYGIIGIAMYSWVFLAQLPSPEAFVQKFDNTFHLNLINVFYQTGNCSPLQCSLYPGTSTEGYYPSLFHALCALLMSTVPCSAPVAENVILLIFVALVFPFGTCALLQTLSKGDKHPIVAGAFATVLFKGFPGNMMLWALFPNIVGYCLIPAALTAFIKLFSAEGKKTAAIYAILFLAFCALTPLTHPNALFCLVLFLLPFLISQIWLAKPSSRHKHPTNLLGKAALSVLLMAIVSALWLIAYCSPLLANATSFTWHAFRSMPQAIADALTLAYRPISTPQFALALFVLIGICRTIRKKEYLWLSTAFAICSFLYVCTASTDGPLKQILTGFWYTDATRIGAIAAMGAIPLAAFGIALLLELLANALEKRAVAPQRKDPKSIFELSAQLVLCCLLAVLVMLPNSLMPLASGTTVIENGYSKDESMRTVPSKSVNSSAFSALRKEYRLLTNVQKNALSADDMDFAAKAKAMLPEDARIINCPYDGSAWLYALYDLDICYRRLSKACPYLGDADKEVPKALDKISADESLHQTIRQAGITHVIQLGNDPEHDLRGNGYRRKGWAGIESISPDTAGFRLLLEEGDHRLYEIL